MPKLWTCKWCGRTNDKTEVYCGHCLNGRTQAIEDEHNRKLGLPRRVLKPGQSR